MRRTAEVVIIGGGVMGASTAYHLAARGCTDVVLLERRSLAAEGTGHSGALVRQHYSQDVVTLIALRSVEIFEQFEELTGYRDVFDQVGWIKLGSEEMRPAMEENLERHRALGVDVRTMSMEELREAIPGINTDGIGAALFEPRGGYADPIATTHGLADAARSRGVEIVEGVTATGIRVENGAVAGVETDLGETISTPTVVDAAGPWGAAVASWVGVDIPIRVTREQDIVLRCSDEALVPRHPVSNGADCIYWRREQGEMLLAGDGHPKEIEYADPDAYDTGHDAAFEEMMAQRLAHRLPKFAELAEVVRGYASLYDVTPDWHPVLGRVPEVEGFMCCTGFSGHGFKLGPYTGKLIAEEILDGEATSLDISSLRLDRFARGALLQGSYAGNQA